MERESRTRAFYRSGEQYLPPSGTTGQQCSGGNEKDVMSALIGLRLGLRHTMPAGPARTHRHSAEDLLCSQPGCDSQMIGGPQAVGFVGRLPAEECNCLGIQVTVQQD